MYIPASILVIIVLFLIMQSPQSEVDDLFGAIFSLALIVLGLAVGFGAIVGVAVLIANYWDQVYMAIATCMSIGLILLVLYVASNHIKGTLITVGVIALIVVAFNGVVYAIQNNFTELSFVVCGALLIGCVISWIPFIKNIKNGSK